MPTILIVGPYRFFFPFLAGEGVGERSMRFLKAAAIPTKSAVQMMKLTNWQIEVTMFTAAFWNG